MTEEQLKEIIAEEMQKHFAGDIDEALSWEELKDTIGSFGQNRKLDKLTKKMNKDDEEAEVVSARAINEPGSMNVRGGKIMSKVRGVGKRISKALGGGKPSAPDAPDAPRQSDADDAADDAAAGDADDAAAGDATDSATDSAEEEGQLLIQPDEMLSGSGFEIQDKELLNHYKKKLHGVVDPKDVEKTLASLVRSKRMVSEIIKRLQEGLDDPLSNQGQSSEKGVFKPGAGDGKYQRVTGTKDRGTPYQKIYVRMRIKDFNQIPDIKNLISKISADSGVDELAVTLVLKQVFENEKLASGSNLGSEADVVDEEQLPVSIHESRTYERWEAIAGIKK